MNRFLLAISLLGGSILFGSLILSAKTDPIARILPLSLILIALAAASWQVFSLATGVALNVLVFLCLAWGWGASQNGLLGLALSADGVLLCTGVWRRRFQFRRQQRMRQVLDDVEEECTVKDQAICVAQQMRDALQKKLVRYTQLQTIAEGLSGLTDLEAIGQLIVERTFELIGKSDVCLLFLVDTNRQELSLFASKRRESVPSIRAKHGDQFDRHVLRTHRPLLVNDARRDFRFTVMGGSEREISSLIACPLLVGQRPEGVLRLDSSQSDAYTQDDLRFLDILLDLFATAVTNARLFAKTQQLAMTDGLTGLMLRRPFLEQLEREVRRALRSRDPLSIVLLDVDHFKAYNDTYGHTAGDVILKTIADILRAVVMPSGTIGRYGGEEFVVLLPHLKRDEALQIAEDIRRAVEQQMMVSERALRRGSLTAQTKTGNLQHSPSEVLAQGVTISLGVASFPEDAQADLELLRLADQRLYAAKHAGRNRVCSQ